MKSGRIEGSDVVRFAGLTTEIIAGPGLGARMTRGRTLRNADVGHLDQHSGIGNLLPNTGICLCKWSVEAYAVSLEDDVGLLPEGCTR
jgi:hypothetical protein